MAPNFIKRLQSAEGGWGLFQARECRVAILCLENLF